MVLGSGTSITDQERSPSPAPSCYYSFAHRDTRKRKIGSGCVQLLRSRPFPGKVQQPHLVILERHKLKAHQAQKHSVREQATGAFCAFVVSMVLSLKSVTSSSVPLLATVDMMLPLIAILAVSVKTRAAIGNGGILCIVSMVLSHLYITTALDKLAIS
uniref:Uncharacterized protein n=1 Tax=Rhipicephalus zambeziensis TaxID=60191 RepID=A0A224Y621_9ACAR